MWSLPWAFFPPQQLILTYREFCCVHVIYTFFFCRKVKIYREKIKVRTSAVINLNTHITNLSHIKTHWIKYGSLHSHLHFPYPWTQCTTFKPYCPETHRVIKCSWHIPSVLWTFHIPKTSRLCMVSLYKMLTNMSDKLMH